jgi:hypothetical protein
MDYQLLADAANATIEFVAENLLDTSSDVTLATTIATTLASPLATTLATTLASPLATTLASSSYQTLPQCIPCINDGSTWEGLTYGLGVAAANWLMPLSRYLYKRYFQRMFPSFPANEQFV